MRIQNDLDTYRPVRAEIGDFAVGDAVNSWAGASDNIFMFQHFVGQARKWMFQAGYDDSVAGDPVLHIRWREGESDWSAWSEVAATRPEPVLLTTLTPNTAEIGGADVTMRARGSGFTESSVINFNGGDETTAYVSPTEVTTIVKPATAGVAGAFPVTVRTGTRTSEPLDFSFTEPAPPEGGESRKGTR